LISLFKSFDDSNTSRRGSAIVLPLSNVDKMRGFTRCIRSLIDAPAVLQC
jgi:hypothetical protein